MKAGQTLYLPAGWFHHVAQGEDDGGGDDEDEEEGDREEQQERRAEKEGVGLCVCVNWWYDAHVGERWAWAQLGSDLAKLINGVPVDDED